MFVKKSVFFSDFFSNLACCCKFIYHDDIESYEGETSLLRSEMVVVHISDK